ncbi:MAG: hypothetical protein ACD_28C00151G0008 [uncultured bacterium]|nr:MAG: hypothetical protein ACD_28C00151G0008 [uncultured bacterium]KKT74752.1 MAG: hypothetical protein UW70_C0046G0010 [Candidatus Peregrinibacteria bacterium GW2011_GWA2_44_7]
MPLWVFLGFIIQTILSLMIMIWVEVDVSHIVESQKQYVGEENIRFVTPFSLQLFRLLYLLVVILFPWLMLLIFNSFPQ